MGEETLDPRLDPNFKAEPNKFIPAEDPYKRDPAEMNPKEYDFSSLMLAIINAIEIANIMREDVLYDQVVRELSLVQTKLDEARLWAIDGQAKFVKPPVM